MPDLHDGHADGGDPLALHGPVPDDAPPDGAGRGLLRFITCGSVDDGKSTLLGRLLYDCKLLCDDQIDQLARLSQRYGTVGPGKLDLALLIDGLAAEREQGITIDVAYRFFATRRRAFIAADTPGHEQYTRNMATAASQADAAVVLVDARKGVLAQTRRHSLIAHRFGIRHVILAVNKMDAVDWREDVFTDIAETYRVFAGRLGIPDIICVPLSGLTGDNVTTPSAAMGWRHGPTLLEQLERLETGPSAARRPFRMPVQWVNRPNADFRGLSGTVTAGDVRPGDALVIQPSGRRATVSRIVTMDGDLPTAHAEQAVTIMLAEDLDAARGDVLACADAPPTAADRFTAHLLCLDEQGLHPNRLYRLQLGTAMVGARIDSIAHALDLDSETLAERDVDHLALNQMGLCRVTLDHPVAFEPYSDSRDLGGFILIDRISNATVGCGMILFGPDSGFLPLPLRIKDDSPNQRPCVLWFTGLPGTGKSTIADHVERALRRHGHRTVRLDDDVLRQGVNRDLGFSPDDRSEAVRRTAEVARLMANAGLIPLVSLISLTLRDRETARLCLGGDAMIEIFVDGPLAVCEARDSKGLCQAARVESLPGFTGIDSPYKAPFQPDLRLPADQDTPEQLAARVLAHLDARGALPSHQRPPDERPC
jgi:bifunctional enzyme CysN/CysC